MAITIISKNSTVASKRPTAANLIPGELGLNLEATDPGLYYEDSAGNIRKVGGCSYGAAAPNAAPAGQAGNSVGELWYDTGASLLKAWDGVAWVGVGGASGQFDWQSGAGEPNAVNPITTKSDGTPLAEGDLYWDTAANSLFAYDAATTSWVAVGGSAGQFDWQAAAGAPTATTRSDGTTLVDGDQYWDQTGNKLYGWDAPTTAWVAVGSAGQFDWQAAAGAPVVAVRSDGTALVDGDQYWDQTGNKLHGWDAGTSAWAVIAGRPWVTSSDTAPVAPTPADLWYDSLNGRTYVYYDDGASRQWVDASPNAGLAKFDWQSAAGDPTTTNPTTLRSDGTALAEGDQYWDTTANQLYAYDLALTSWAPVGSGGLTVSATAPVGPTEGDLWYNENDSRTYAAVNNLGGTAVWVDASPDGQRALITTSDNAPASPTEDDLWWNSTDGRMYVYYNDGTSTQWVETSPLRDPASIPPNFDPVPGDLVISADTNLSGPVLCKNLTIDAGVTVTVPNFELIITATESVTINGSIVADASGANGVLAIAPSYSTGAGVITGGGFSGWNGPGSALKTYSPTLYLGGSGAGESYYVINTTAQGGGFTRSAGGVAGGAIAIRAYGDITMGAGAVISANGQGGSVYSGGSGDIALVGTSGGSGGTIILHSSGTVTTAGTISAIGGNGGAAGCAGGGCTSSLGGGHGGGGGTVILQGATVTNGATVTFTGGTGGVGIDGAGVGLQLGATTAPANGGLGGSSNALGGAVNGNPGATGVLLNFGSPL